MRILKRYNVFRRHSSNNFPVIEASNLTFKQAKTFIKRATINDGHFNEVHNIHVTNFPEVSFYSELATYNGNVFSWSIHYFTEESKTLLSVQLTTYKALDSMLRNILYDNPQAEVNVLSYNACLLRMTKAEYTYLKDNGLLTSHKIINVRYT